jgi:hypothetical protein
MVRRLLWIALGLGLGLPVWAQTPGAVTNWQGVAFYYGWYDAATFPYQYFKAIPNKGFYDSRDPWAVDQMIQEAYDHGITVFAYNFYCNGGDRDTGICTQGYNWEALEVLRDRMAAQAGQRPMRFLIFYDQAISMYLNCRITPKDFNFNHEFERIKTCLNNAFRNHFQAMRDRPNILSHDRYLRIQGKPVVAIYLTRSWKGHEGASCRYGPPCTYHEAVRDVRNQSGAGYTGPLYVVGDEIWPDKGDCPGAGNFCDIRIDELDAVTAYGTGGAPFVGENQVTSVADKSGAIQQQWAAHLPYVRNQYTGQPVAMMPAAIPRYDESHLPDRIKERCWGDCNLNLYVTPNFHEDAWGHGFSRYLRLIQPLASDVGGGTGYVWLTSWNEWFETSSLEPTAGPAISCGHPNNCFRYHWGTRPLELVQAYLRGTPPGGPTPTITSVDPSLVTMDEQAEVTVQGSGFDTDPLLGSWVYVGTRVLGATDPPDDISVKAVYRVNSNQLRVLLPPWDYPGPATLRVVNRNGVASAGRPIVIRSLLLDWVGPPVMCVGRSVDVGAVVSNLYGPYTYGGQAWLEVPPGFTLESPQYQSVVVAPGSRQGLTWRVRVPGSAVSGQFFRFYASLSYCPNPNYCEDFWLEREMRVDVKSGPSFTDVSCDHPLFGFVERLKDRRITAGCAVDRYCPDASITRGQMAVFLTRARGDSPESPCRSGMEDVGGHPFCGFIENLLHQGIAEPAAGSFSRFEPDQALLRKDMAYWTLRAMGRRAPRCVKLVGEPPNTTCTFTDVGGISKDRQALIERGYYLGVYSGVGNGQFGPDLPLTRAQMAVFLVRAFDL